ncbi:MAG: hypothetical protein WC623_07810 [Pedobacter sp.]|uniref:hypothetical protein n=1 Tax=Pedobacter sp. TaxID=1411316 RepID=UPI0035635B47
MIRKQLLLLGVVFFESCAINTPESLATEVCDCYRQSKSYKNTTKELKKLDECYMLTQANLKRLQKLGAKNDWSDDQVQKEMEKFDNILNKCNGNSSE